MAQRLAPTPSRMTTSTLHLSPPRVGPSPPCAAAVGYPHTPRSPRVSAARAWFPWCSLVTLKCLLAVPIELLEDTSRQDEHQRRKENRREKKDDRANDDRHPPARWTQREGSPSKRVACRSRFWSGLDGRPPILLSPPPRAPPPPRGHGGTFSDRRCVRGGDCD